MKVTIKDLYDFDKETGLVGKGNINVNTPTGLKKIEYVDITKKDSIKLLIKTKNHSITISPEHLLYKNGWIESNKLNIGDYIDTEYGYEKIIDIKEDNIKEDLYDIQVIGEQYYANGVRSHNSTIKQSLELCLFGKVQGKSGKRLALSKLPNRRNGSLYTGVYFKNQVMDNVVMKRYLQPNNFEMFVNEEPLSERFKVMSEKEREKIIGYNFEIFKSFISLNMNDFKNFISLSKDDKESLLNKIFNLKELDILYSITKDLDNNNQKIINDIDNKIYKNEQTISEYRQTIQNIKNKENFSKDERMNFIKNEIMSKKPLFEEYQNNIKDLNNGKSDLNKKIFKLTEIKSEKNKEKTRLEIEIENIEEKIKIYNSGKCPTCDTKLIDDNHKNHLINYQNHLNDKKNKMSECEKFLDKCVIEDTKLRNNMNDIYNKTSNYQTKLSELKIELSSLNNEYKKLKNENNNDLTSILESKIKKLKVDNNKHNNLLIELNEKSKNYNELKNILSVDGVRKTIIKNALTPINNHLNCFLTELNSEYGAKLNDNFDAIITELGILEIDSETLSKGEDKKINIAIALSYLKLILEMKHTNIIFLDEIFDGIDVENIQLILKVLKQIAKEHKINIIIVNHGMKQIVDVSIFDKIIKVEKEIFSNITIN